MASKVPTLYEWLGGGNDVLTRLIDRFYQKVPTDTAVAEAPMPAWNWGVSGGPYHPDPAEDDTKA
jgi:truncated hemoglobin YjbI